MDSYQTSPTVVSLEGRLPQKLQSKSTLSCGIVQIHFLFLLFDKYSELKKKTISFALLKHFRKGAAADTCNMQRFFFKDV